MTNKTERKELEALLERLRVEQTVEDMEAEIDGRTQTTSEASVDKAMTRIQASLDRFARGEAVGVTESATPRVSAIRASWDTLRETLAWLTIPFESVPVQAAAGTSRAPGTAAAGASLSVDQISDQAPEGLQWVPARTHVPAPGQIEFILAWTGPGEAVAPTAVDLRSDGDPVDTAKIAFDPYVGSLTIRLAGMDHAPKTIGLAQQEDETLTLNLSSESG